MLSSVLLGFGCVTLIIATMLPAIHQLSRIEFIALVFGSYVAKRTVEVFVVDISFSVVVAASSFVCPFAIMFMIDKGARQESAFGETSYQNGAISPIWTVALAISAVCTSKLLGGPANVLALSDGYPVLAWDLIGSTLLTLASGLLICRSTIPATYRQLFAIGSTVGLCVFLSHAINGIDLPLGSLTIFCGLLLWLPVYDCVRERVCAPLRLYGVCIIGQIVLSVSMQSGGVIGVAFLWATCCLAVAAGLAAPWLEKKMALQYTVAEEGRSLSEALDGACHNLAVAKGLSQRESEVLTLLAKGMSRQAIGEKLLLSEATVKTHIYRIYAKLDVHSQTELAELLYG